MFELSSGWLTSDTFISDYAERAAANADAVPEFVATDNGSATLDEWIHLIVRARREFDDAGVCAGARVAVVSDGSIEEMSLFVAAVSIGVCWIPIDPNYGERTIDHIIDRLGVKTVLRPGGAHWKPRQSEALPDEPENTASTLAFLTSGTTGQPKLLEFAQDQVESIMNAILTRIPYSTVTQIVCPVPLHFDYGLYQVLFAVACGKPILVTAGSIGLIHSQVHIRRGALLCLVPTLAASLHVLMSRGSLREVISNVAYITFTGERLSKELFDQLCHDVEGVGIFSMYGLTECKRVSISEPRFAGGYQEDTGLPIPDVEVFAIDELSQRTEVGVRGELVVRSSHVASDAVTHVGPCAGLLKTGDYGYIAPNGGVIVLGRIGLPIKLHGRRIDLSSLDWFVSECRGVESSFVCVRAGSVYVVFTGHIAPSDIRVMIRHEFGAAMDPLRVARVDCLPTDRRGKTDREACLRLLEDGDSL